MTSLGQGSTTPILDLEAPLPPARDDRLTRKEIVGVVVLALAGVIVPVVTSLPLPPQRLPVEEMSLTQVNDELLFFFLLTLFGLPLIWITVVAIHELGHLVAVGGPVVEIPFAGIAFAAAANIRHPALFLVAFYFGVCFGMSAFLSLIPIRSGSSWEHVNDADFLWALFTAKHSAAQLIAQHALGMLKNRALDELQLNPRWVRLACTGSVTWDDWQAFASLTPPGAVAAAAEYLERCLAASGSLSAEDRDPLIIEVTIFTAWSRDDAAKADIWSTRVARPQDLSRYRVFRSEVALHCAHRRFDEALDYWQRGLLWIQSLSEPWVRPYEHSWIEWRAEIENRKVSNRTGQRLPLPGVINIGNDNKSQNGSISQTSGSR